MFTIWACYISSGSVFRCEFNCDVHFAIGLTYYVIFRIGTYIYAFCIKFKCEFNCDVHFAIGLPIMVIFRIGHIYMHFALNFSVNST